jgi:hypothetical protein
MAVPAWIQIQCFLSLIARVKLTVNDINRKLHLFSKH